MEGSTALWFTLTILCIGIHAFYGMMEMTSVSFNKVRLHYYVSIGDVKAKMIENLLSNPSKLFGTTLVGVNVALQIGSECSRMFYLSLGLNPNISPLSHVILVLIFAELAPMFAARRYSEHTAMLGIRAVYLSSKILTPITWTISLFARAITALFSTHSQEGSFFLTRDELQKVIEGLEEPQYDGKEEHDDFEAIASNIFNLKNKTAEMMMIPLKIVHMLPATQTIGDMRRALRKTYHPYIPIFERVKHHVIGIAHPCKLIAIEDDKKLKEHIQPPWFITKDATAQHILREFRSRNQDIAVVLDEEGDAIGILTLQDVVAEIFGEMNAPLLPRRHHRRALDKTLPGTMTIATFNRKFDANIPYTDNETLAHLIKSALGHDPERAETVRIQQFEFTVVEATLLGIQSIAVKTVIW